jgi:hypothetical protein
MSEKAAKFERGDSPHLSQDESTGSSLPAPRVRPAEPSPGANTTTKTITSAVPTNDSANAPDPSSQFDAQITKVTAKLAEYSAQRKRITIDNELLDADEVSPTENPIFEQILTNTGRFPVVCGFSNADFQVLYDNLGGTLAVQKRGRT